MTELRGQHDEIGLTAKLLAEATADLRTPRSVAAIRWQLARRLIAHLALEDRILYPAMQRAPDDRTRTVAAKLQTETGALAEVFTRYMSSWTDERIAREWRAFCAETQQILKALGERIEREDRTLYPLAEHVDPSAPRMARTG
ncbi:MAG: hemerythrin domain-containing protein [bacterium]|nr:hemerythrin domain-containing protein [bacterium]